MYVIKNNQTGKYWNGKTTGDMYTSDLQEAFAFHDKEDFYLGPEEEYKEVEVKYTLRKVGEAE